MDEMDIVGELGKGNYGSVQQVFHRPTGVMMAMKVSRCTYLGDSPRLILVGNPFGARRIEIERYHHGARHFTSSRRP